MENNKMKTIKIVIPLIIILFLAGCQKELNFKCLKAKGDEETRTLSFVDFTEITIDVPCELTLTQGSEYEVTIQSTTNVIDRIERDSRINGNDLDIDINGCDKLKNNDVIINITLPILDQLDIDGSLIVTSSNTLSVGESFKIIIDGSSETSLTIDSTRSVSLEIDGSGSIDLDGATCDELNIKSDGSAAFDCVGLAAKKVKIDADGSCSIKCHVTEEISIGLKGSGEIEAQGQATRQDIMIDGSGKVFNFDLLADDTNVEIEGSGKIEVDCVNTLDVRIEGSGTVCYRGNPILTNTIDGSGSIANCN